MSVHDLQQKTAAGTALLAAAGLWLLAGCASPANPRPPSLHLEEVPAPPQAARLGDEVVLTWSTPTSTTDGGRPELPLTAVLCRENMGPARTPCTPVLRVATAPGASGQASETLPPALLGAHSLLAYRVEIRNRRGRSAGLSAPGFVAAGAAPAPVGPLTVTGQPGGALLVWAAVPSSGTMEVTRTPVAPPAPAQPPAQPAAKTGKSTSPFAADPTAPVLLRPAAPAPNGMLDPAVLEPRSEGVTFRYTAQRVESVQLGGQRLELRGLASPPAVFTYTHSFAPPPPSGLVAIPALAPPAIDLSWEASLSPDLLGYNVYRSSAADPAFRLLNSRPVSIPSFRDATVLPGRPYSYRVTTLDRHHNQSAPSVEVRESVLP